MKRFTILAALAVALFAASTADARHRARASVVVVRQQFVPVIVQQPVFVQQDYRSYGTVRSFAFRQVVEFDTYGRRCLYEVDHLGGRRFLRFD